MRKDEILKKIGDSGLSISEIARRLGVTRVTIYTWVDGEEKSNHDKILSVLPSDSNDLEQIKKMNKILLEKITALEKEIEELSEENEDLKKLAVVQRVQSAQIDVAGKIKKKR